MHTEIKYPKMIEILDANHASKSFYVGKVWALRHYIVTILQDLAMTTHVMPIILTAASIMPTRNVYTRTKLDNIFANVLMNL